LTLFESALVLLDVLRPSHKMKRHVTVMWQRKLRRRLPLARNLFKIFKLLWMDYKAATEMPDAAGEEGAGPVSRAGIAEVRAALLPRRQ